MTEIAEKYSQVNRDRSPIDFQVQFKEEHATSTDLVSDASTYSAKFRTNLMKPDMRIEIVLPKLGWLQRQLGRILRLPGGYKIISMGDTPALSFTDEGLRRVTYEVQGDFDGGIILAF